MSRLIRNKKLIGSTSNDSSHIIYDPSDTSRSETTVKSELDRLNAGIPAIDVGNAVTDWTNTESATSASQGSDNYSTLNAMSPSSTIKSLLTSIKSLLFGLSTQVTSLNTQLSAKANKSYVDTELAKKQGLVGLTGGYAAIANDSTSTYIDRAYSNGSYDYIIRDYVDKKERDIFQKPTTSSSYTQVAHEPYGYIKQGVTQGVTPGSNQFTFKWTNDGWIEIWVDVTLVTKIQGYITIGK
jgi:hypothetical protein